MKLVTYLENGQLRLGALRNEKTGEVVVDLKRLEPWLPSDIISFLEAGERLRVLAASAVADAPAGAGVPLESVVLQAPVPRPGKLVCVGRNYAEHAAESNVAPTETPIIFAKYTNTVIGHGEAIVLPKISRQVDYEGELAVVIGRQAREVDEADALTYVGGYMPFNDVSARDLQWLNSQWTLAKSCDTFAPMGPALVTADEVPDPQDLELRVSVNGEEMQHDNTRNMVFSVAYLISYLSQVMTLEPGDVIATGTPAGVGFARKPPRWLKAGDVVRVEIERLGALENPVIDRVQQ